jgi:hypothetical protein
LGRHLAREDNFYVRRRLSRQLISEGSLDALVDLAIAGNKRLLRPW